MAAVLTPAPSTTSFATSLLATSPYATQGVGGASDAAPWNAPAPVRPSLTVVDGGRSAASVRRRRRAVVRALATVGAGLALAAAVALAAVGASSLLGADAAASGPASTAAATDPVGAGPSTPAPTEVAVEAGDTLWAIARRLQPSGDVRPLVDALAERAGGAALVVGQRIDVSGLAD